MLAALQLESKHAYLQVSHTEFNDICFLINELWIAILTSILIYSLHCKAMCFLLAANMTTLKWPHSKNLLHFSLNPSSYSFWLRHGYPPLTSTATALSFGGLSFMGGVQSRGAWVPKSGLSAPTFQRGPSGPGRMKKFTLSLPRTLRHCL